MLLKNEVLGIRCELETCQNETCHDETRVSVNNNKILVKTHLIDFLEPLEKFAVLGEKACYIKSSGIINLIGPTASNSFLVRINSRGNLHEFFVPEEDVLFLR